MNKNKKLIVIISSIVATVLAGVIIFLTIFFNIKKKADKEKKFDHDKLTKEIAALKKEHDQLLTQMPKNVNWQSYVDDFYDEEAQKEFQQQKEEIKKEIKDLNVTCNQSDLKAQKQCLLDCNQKVKQTINNFHHFNDSYYDSYQKFNTTLNTTKKQFFNNLVNISKLNTTELNNKEYDLNFFSPEKQNEFQNNKNQIIATIQQFNNSQTEQIATCSQNKTLYQQLMCYQEKNVIINETIKNFNSFDDDYHHNYQIFNATFNATKKQFDNLLANATKEFDDDEKKLNNLKFLNIKEIKQFKKDKNQVIAMIKQFNTTKEKCFQNKILYQQAECYQENVAYLVVGYDQIKAEKKFLELKDQFLTLDISELKTTELNVNFLSVKNSQKNLINMISQFQDKLQNEVEENKKSYNNNFYQQLKSKQQCSYQNQKLRYYQQKNQEIEKKLKLCQDFKQQYFDNFKSSLSTLIAEIKQEIKVTEEKQQKLINKMAKQNTNKEQNVVDKTATKIQEIQKKIADFEKEIKQYQNLPWSQFKSYHDFLVKYQEIFKESKKDISFAKDSVDMAISRIPTIIKFKTNPTGNNGVPTSGGVLY